MSKAVNDAVEQLHRELTANEEYLGYLRATCNAEAVEGSIEMDDYKAAMMIRARALEFGHVVVTRKKLGDISKALNVVLRRYGMSRKQRRNGVMS